MELLSGQAVVEAREYQIMEWDEMQEVKKVRVHFSPRRWLPGARRRPRLTYRHSSCRLRYRNTPFSPRA